MIRNIFIATAILLISLGAGAQRYFELPVWTEGQCKDADYAVPRLFCYLPEKPNGKAIVACPGGAYMGLAIDHEGKNFAPLLNKEGYALFVLKYRLPAGRYTVPMADAEQAMRIVRSHASEWNLKKIGIMGSSAGGHLASTLATHYKDTLTRPDFQILLYPVITMNEKFTHMGSRNALLGNNPSAELVEEYSNELHVPEKAPEAFIVLSSGDFAVPVYNSLQYAQSLVNKGVLTDLHMYEGGYHGFGYSKDFADHDQWLGELLYWLKKQ